MYAPGRPGGGRPHRVSTVAPPLPPGTGFPLLDNGPRAIQGRRASGTNVAARRLATAPRAATTDHRHRDREGRSDGAPAWLRGRHLGERLRVLRRRVKDHAANFYEVRLWRGGTHATATKLPIPADTAPIGYIAVSPDGSKLAISTLVQHGPFGDIQNLVVAATSTGAERRWSTPAGTLRAAGPWASWLAGQRKVFAFNWVGGAQVSPSTGLRLLDTSAPVATCSPERSYCVLTTMRAPSTTTTSARTGRYFSALSHGCLAALQAGPVRSRGARTCWGR